VWGLCWTCTAVIRSGSSVNGADGARSPSLAASQTQSQQSSSSSAVMREDGRLAALARCGALAAAGNGFSAAVAPPARGGPPGRPTAPPPPPPPSLPPNGITRPPASVYRVTTCLEKREMSGKIAKKNFLKNCITWLLLSLT